MTGSSVAPALREWAPLVVPGLIWGTSFLFIAEALDAVKPMGLTFLRILVGFIVLALVPGARRPIRGVDRRWVALLGVVWMAFPLSLFPFAEQHVSSALTGMLNGATPILVAVVAALLSRSAPSRAVQWGLVVGLIGTVLIALPGLRGGANSVLGVTLVLLAISSYGVALNLSGPLQRRNGALPIIWRAQGVALVLTAPFGLPTLPSAEWRVAPLLCLLALGGFGTGVAYVVAASATGTAGPTRAAATTFLIPVVALVLGVVIRDERVSPVSVFGAGICLYGAWMVARARAQDRPAATADPAPGRTPATS